MPDEKPIAPTPQPPPDAAKAVADRAAAMEAPSEFSSKLMAAMNEANAKVAHVKAPDMTPPKNYDRDQKAGEQPHFDPKGILPPPTEEQKVAAVKAAEAKATPKAGDDYPDNAKSDEAKNSWQKLKADRDEKAKLFAERDAELLELKKRYDPVAYEKAVKENEALTQRIRILDVESHPKFKETYDKPITDAVALAKRSIPESFHGDVEKILRQPDSPARDKAITEITDQLPLHKQTRFALAIEQATTAVENKQTALKSEQAWVENFNREQTEQKERARIQTDAQAKTLFQTVLKQKFADNPLFDLSDEASKDANQQRITRAESLLFGANAPEALAEAVLWAEYGRDVRPILVAAHAELERLTKLVDKQSGQSMGKTTAGASQANGGPKSFAEAVMAKMREG